MANIIYKRPNTGLKLFHHIFSPNTSGPVFLEPEKYIYINPIPMANVGIERYGKYWMGMFLAININNVLVIIHPNKNKTNLF